MTKYKDGWIDLFTDRNRDGRERQGRLNHSTFSDSFPMECTSKARTDAMTGCRREGNGGLMHCAPSSAQSSQGIQETRSFSSSSGVTIHFLGVLKKKIPVALM